MKYNYSYNVTYKNILNLDMQNTQYRKDLLNVFYLEQDNFDSLSKRINLLFHKINHDDSLWNTLLQKSASRIMTTDKETGFMMLFSFDTFDIIHKLLIHYFKFNTINNKILQNLLEKI